MLATLRALGALGLLLAGCGTARGTKPSPERTQAPAAAAAAKVDAPAASGSMLKVEAGRVRAGSSPGTPRRDPTREADLVPVALSAFEIDRAPFPPEGAQTDAVELDYADASAACASAGKRLCSELEWESGCNLAGIAAFAAKAREWTLSDGSDANANTRGGDGQDLARCGARSLTARTAQLGFRCCRGEPQQAAYPAPPASSTAPLGAHPLQLSTDDIRKALAGIQDLAALAPSFQPFSTSDADAALRRGKRTRDGITAWTLLPSSIAWTPAAGDDLVIFAGTSGDQTLIAVLYPLGDGSYAHAASAILREPDTSIALARRVVDPTPRELLWTSCYGCPNEGGTIRYGDDRRVVIEFR